MTRIYRYVGPLDIKEQAVGSEGSLPVTSQVNLHQCLRKLGGSSPAAQKLTVTFVIDADGRLRLADRHSEHVACAGLRDVQSAGEMTFGFSKDGECFVETVTNQSTGYCPEPDSWKAVDHVLNQLGIVHSIGFEPEFVFRRCRHCQHTNVVKDEWFVCLVCGSDLSLHWNFDE